MSQFDKDLQSSVGFFVDGAIGLMKHAMHQEAVVTMIMDRVSLVTALAELPGDAVMRARCFPNLFQAKA